jgi:AbrB family looped-hinge helix DNA binding protein
MENADVVVVSSKGQVVIPQGLRRKLRIEAKSKLLVYPYSGALIMKKLDIQDA